MIRTQVIGIYPLGTGGASLQSLENKYNGTTLDDVTDYDLDPNLPPNARNLSLFRLTFFWFTPEYICWATDDNKLNTGARLVISPRKEPLDIRVIGRVSHNEMRSAIEFPGIGWLLITENKSGYVGIELVFIYTNFDIIPVGILNGITDNFTASVASRRACWDEQKEGFVAYSLARLLEPSIVRYTLYRNYALDLDLHYEEGGIVGVEPTSSYGYSKGTKVRVTAEPYSGYVFTGWSGDFFSPSKSLELTMDHDIHLTAHFYPEGMTPEYKVSVTTFLTLFLLSGFLLLSGVFVLGIAQRNLEAGKR